MGTYETIFVLDPSLDDRVLQKEIEKVESLITSSQGKIVKTEKWGLKKFAYPIKKKVQGFYTLIYFEGEENIPAELERSFKLNESCLRYLTVTSKAQIEKVDSEEQKNGEDADYSSTE